MKQLFACAPDTTQGASTLIGKCTQPAQDVSGGGFVVPDTLVAAVLTCRLAAEYGALLAHSDATVGDVDLGDV